MRKPIRTTFIPSPVAGRPFENFPCKATAAERKSHAAALLETTQQSSVENMEIFQCRAANMVEAYDGAFVAPTATYSDAADAPTTPRV